MKHGSLFSGVGGMDLAAAWAGWQNVFHCEINPFCQKVLKHHFPDSVCYSNIRQTDFTPWRDRVDIVSGGFPCFVKGTKVLTNQGYRNIDQVRIGQQALTKEGRFMPVNAVMSKEGAKTLRIQCVGDFDPLTTTPEHPFWVKRKQFTLSKDIKKRYAPPEWVEARDIEPGCRVGFRCFEGHLDYRDKYFWYLVGRYLGNGWRIDKKSNKNISASTIGRTSKNDVILCCNPLQADDLLARINEAGLQAKVTGKGRVAELVITSAELAAFVREFGLHAHTKKLTGLCFQLKSEFKEALFSGWLDADGYTDKNGRMSVATLSEELAYGMAQVARDCFKRPVTIVKGTVNRCWIAEGQRVRKRPTYRVIVADTNRFGHYEGGFVWQTVKSVEEGSIQTVYNIGVQTDESYTANGIAVHNCQPFSQAGKRKGTADDRYLWPEMLRAIREIRPRYVLGENVLGIVNWNDGMVFEQVCADLETEGYEVQPFVLPACGVNAPHQRYRTWFVAYNKNFSRHGDNGGRGIFSSPKSMEMAGNENRIRLPNDNKPGKSKVPDKRSDAQNYYECGERRRDRPYQSQQAGQSQTEFKVCGALGEWPQSLQRDGGSHDEESKQMGRQDLHQEQVPFSRIFQHRGGGEGSPLAGGVEIRLADDSLCNGHQPTERGSLAAALAVPPQHWTQNCTTGQPGRATYCHGSGSKPQGYVWTADYPHGGSALRIPGSSAGESGTERLPLRDEVQHPDQPDRLRRNATDPQCGGGVQLQQDLQSGQPDGKRVDSDGRERDASGTCAGTPGRWNTGNPGGYGHVGYTHGDSGDTVGEIPGRYPDPEPCRVCADGGQGRGTDRLPAGDRAVQPAEANAGFLSEDARSDVAHADGQLPQCGDDERHEGRHAAHGTEPFGEPRGWEEFPTQSPLCFGNDGASHGLVGITFSKWRNESVKALGNAVVPQVVLQIFRAINQMEGRR